MHKIKIDEKLYNFPSKLSEVTLGQFQEIVSLKAMGSIKDNIDLTIKIISILMKVSEEFLNTIPYTDIVKLAKLCGFIFDSTNEEPKFEVVIDNVKYVMLNEISKMSTAEYIDLDTLLSDKENAVSNLHLIMGILYRPATKKNKIEPYNSETLNERAELFKEKMTCNYAVTAMLFSLALVQASSELIQDYSQNKNEFAGESN